MKSIRKARKSGNAIVLTVTDFLESGKFYELTKENNVTIIKEMEMKVKENK